MMEKVFIIAEVGVNHNGNLELAKEMVDAASCAGADAVKFQTFKAEEGISKFAPKAEYQKKATGSNESQLDMVKKLELDEQAHRELIVHCKKRNIKFMSTPFDDESVELLYKLGLDVFKIGSGEITRLPLLKKIGSLEKKIILSTGMADLKEIKEAVEILIKAGTDAGSITLLHCNTEYPTPMEDVNLKAIKTLASAFPNMKVGYSDHTSGIEVAIAAVAIGAVVIEKHFTLDKNMKGPDHQASLEPDELKAMVRAIRNIEKALGDGIKRPSASELKNIPIVRRSIVAAKDIRKGQTFTERNLSVKRPGTGLSPMRWDELIGKKAKYNFKKDELIRE